MHMCCLPPWRLFQGQALVQEYPIRSWGRPRGPTALGPAVRGARARGGLPPFSGGGCALLLWPAIALKGRWQLAKRWNIGEAKLPQNPWLTG